MKRLVAKEKIREDKILEALKLIDSLKPLGLDDLYTLSQVNIFS